MASKIRSQRADAIVLKHNDYGEADRMITLFTRGKGKIRAIVKGARKAKSRKAGHVEPFTHVSVQISKGRNWYILTQAEAVNIFMNLRSNLESLGYASYIAELVDKFILEDESNPPVFRLLRDSLERIHLEEPTFKVVRYFEIQLLALLGFKPELKNCVVTGNKILPQTQYFSSSLGGAVSPEAGRGSEGVLPISIEGLKFLRHFQRSSYQQAIKLEISKKTEMEVELITQHYMTYILETNLKTPSFLRRLRNKN
jgi:DNA repair protein RecO (recombination protein O)